MKKPINKPGPIWWEFMQGTHLLYSFVWLALAGVNLYHDHEKEAWECLAWMAFSQLFSLYARAQKKAAQQRESSGPRTV